MSAQDPDEDELFKLTTKGGKLEIEREKVRALAQPAVAVNAAPLPAGRVYGAICGIAASNNCSDGVAHLGTWPPRNWRTVEAHTYHVCDWTRKYIFVEQAQLRGFQLWGRGDARGVLCSWRAAITAQGARGAYP